jgi:hypothetical protein
MRKVLVAILALAALTGAAHAHYNVAEFIFGKQSQTLQRLEEEAFGNEFRRPTHQREQYPGAGSGPLIVKH